ncbi:MAG: hypothetical protein NTZ16_13040 [Verrucomicrobia bacterium]|nr:hypothetical protein [Verrucomicrobiota bacterium]
MINDAVFVEVIGFSVNLRPCGLENFCASCIEKNKVFGTFRQLWKIDLRIARVIARTRPSQKFVSLSLGYFFGGGFWKDRTCLEASEKLTDWGDAATACWTRPRTPAKSLTTCGGT